MARKLDEELADSGCDMHPGDFRQLLSDVFNEMFPSWTDEELTVHPSKGLKFCREVRRRADCPRLRERTIMRTLTNIRKSPRAYA